MSPESDALQGGPNFQSDDGTIRGSFPYNIPRRSASLPRKLVARPDEKGTPVYKAEHGEWKERAKLVNEEDAGGVHKSDGTSASVAQKEGEVSSFSLRPVTRTGRVIYRDPGIRNTGYGFGEENALEISTLNRSESAVIRKNLKTWIREVNYRASVAETSPFTTIMEARLVGFALGGVGFYYGSQYFQRSQNLPIRSKVALSFLYGCFCSWGLKYWVTPAAYIELLQKNTPLGYKARQFLDDHRRQTSGLKRTNWFDFPVDR